MDGGKRSRRTGHGRLDSRIRRADAHARAARLLLPMQGRELVPRMQGVQGRDVAIRGQGDEILPSDDEAFGLESLPATDDTLVKLGADAGLDKDRLRKEMHSDAVEEAFEQDR